jgi:hypothetical protein
MIFLQGEEEEEEEERDQPKPSTIDRTQHSMSANWRQL